ncbi:MAG: hypothetical protein RIE77_10120 [Phycisphaerales bacterium]
MRHRAIAVLALSGLALASHATAAAAPSPWFLSQAAGLQQTADRNAALDYWRLVNTTSYADDLPARAGEAFKLLHPDPEGEDQAIEAPATLLPGGELAAELAEIADFMDDLERASRETHCDFQVRYEDGYAALLPHLGHMRNFARLLVTDARRLALAGDTTGAADRLATSLRMARHITGDRILISSLVSAAITDMTIKEAYWLFQRTQDAPEIRQILGKAADRFPADDPHKVELALRTERDLVASLARQFRGPTAGREFASLFLPMTGDSEEQSVESELQRLDGGQFKSEVEKAVDAFDLVFEAWNAADPPAELRMLGEHFASGDFGPVAVVVVPAFGRAYKSDARARETLEAFRARVNDDG